LQEGHFTAIICGRVAPEAIIDSDGWRGYDELVDVGYSKHFRVEHAANVFPRGTSVALWMCAVTSLSVMLDPFMPKHR
jgi:hypothetical protein